MGMHQAGSFTSQRVPASSFNENQAQIYQNKNQLAPLQQGE
jgi:hypothetical protein